MSEVSDIRKKHHLLWRAGFGPSVNDLSYRDITLKKLLDKIFELGLNPVSLNLVQSQLSTSSQRSEMTLKEKKMNRSIAKRYIYQLGQRWFESMVSNPDVLGERMTLFWAGLFACQTINPYKAQDFLNLIRKHALGNFGELLTAVSKHPVMLRFLNNQMNRKQHPNENFARELMELFTLGRGNYTEQDVREAARAFTGWTFNDEGAFEFKMNWHDNGIKSFLGESGDFDGDEILRIILSKKQCARYIAMRIYKHFVNDVPDEQRIQLLADEFYSSGYDIRKLMYSIFSSSFFYDEKNIAIKLKMPMVLLAGLARNFSIGFPSFDKFRVIQKLLGQELFNPPNVAGWPEDLQMINNSTLMLRLSLAEQLIGGREIVLKPKSEYDAEAAMNLKNFENQDTGSSGKRRPVFFNWQNFQDVFRDSGETLAGRLGMFLLQSPENNKNIEIIKSKITNMADENGRIRKTAIAIMGLPEYQLC